MKNAIRCAAFYILPMLLVAFALPMIPMAHAAVLVSVAHPHSLMSVVGAGAGMSIGMLRIQAVGKRRAELERQVNPASANEPESIPWVYYDSQDIANAAAGPFSFFANNNADKTISNLEQAGTIPDPFYFEIEAVNLDFLAKGGTTATAAGVMEDLAEILYAQRAVFVLTFAGKEYLRIPLTYLHSSGGPLGVVSANLTAPLIYEFANNSFPDGGFYIGKKITIPPKQSFQSQIQLAGAPTMVATRKFRVSMAGVLHRRVL